MKKIVSFSLLLSLCLLSACSGLPKETYTYETKDELAVSIEKTKVYDDKIVVYFSKGAFSEVEEVSCYNAEFEYIAEDTTFEAKEDVLTVYSSKPYNISGMKITVNHYLYYHIRYLDSDAYAMLQGDWADDYGYFVSGDKEAFYTEAEKEKQMKLQEERRAEQTRAYTMLEGTWDSEDGLTRLVFVDGDKLSVEIYKYNEGGWELSQTINGYSISLDEEAEPVCIEIEEARGYSTLYSFYLNEDKSEFTCSCVDGNFYKVISEEAE